MIRSIRVFAAMFILGACSSDAPESPASQTPASPSTPATLRITEYVIQRAGAFPHDPALAPDGTVWYTDQTNSFIGRLNPTTGAISDIATPTPGSAPHGMVGFDPRSERFETVRIPGSVVRNVASDPTNQRIWLALSGTQRIGKLEFNRP